MKGPTRPAPALPGFAQNRYSPVTNWNDDLFAADVFEPTPQFAQKKKPPPRPPPPKLPGIGQPELPVKPSHFIRRPTVLTSLLTRKTKTTSTSVTHSHTGYSSALAFSDFPPEVPTQKLFPKCEVKSGTVQTGALIDLSSPPSSPTFTTRSSSDGLSVDSFGSDATSSTNHIHAFNGGNASQAESGFEDDFDLFVTNKKSGVSKDDTLDDFGKFDPFSPPHVQIKPPILRKPVLNRGRDVTDMLCNGRTIPSAVHTHKVPTIIRAKPARPKPPENSALLKSTFGNSLPLTTMNVNMLNPIQKVNTGFTENVAVTFPDNKAFDWEEDSTPERESSPPMPSVPPPPPPELEDSDEDFNQLAWPMDVKEPEPSVLERRSFVKEGSVDIEEPYAVALYDYFGDHSDDLQFSANMKIKLIRRLNEEWLCGRLRSGAEGVFPANYVDIKVPLPSETLESTPTLGFATALYDFDPAQPGDLRLKTGAYVNVINQLNEEWYFGESNGLKGQFPANYVQMH